MMRRPTISLLCISLFVVAWSNAGTNIANAAADKHNKDNEREFDDDEEWETKIPTSAPIMSNRDGDEDTMFTPLSTTVDNPGSNNRTANAPVTAPVTPPVAQENADSTEDLDEDETTLQDEMKEACRAVSRGIAVTTNTSIQIQYNFDILTTTATPLYTGIAVNNAVTNYLMGLYIKPFCNTNNTNKLIRRQKARSLQDGSGSTSASSFGYGDVRGVARGKTTVLIDETCDVPAEDTGTVACHRLQTTNIVYFRNDFIPLDDDGLPIVDDIEKEILIDISTAFGDGTIETNVVKGGETGLQNSTYTSGAVNEITVQGEQKARSGSESSNSSGGLTRAGKAFLTLFLLCLIGVLCYFGYKYCYPKLKDHYPKIRERFARPQPRNGATTPSDTEQSFQAEHTNPLSALWERFQRKVPSEVDRPYDFIASDSRLDRKDRNVLISDTMESSSTDGYGTEMILEDLQEEEVRLSPNTTTPSSGDYRFTPNTLPNTKEYERKDGRRLNFEQAAADDDVEGQSSFDQFSFSDVNIVIDDSSSYASSPPPNFVPATLPIRRPYSVPDTVNL